jgi:RNA polymerase sigma factor (sigma-70 family)
MRDQARSNESLLEAIRTGDTSAWSDFFAAFDPLIASVLAWPKWQFAPHTRDELAQVIRAELVRSLRNLHASATLETFIKRICINRCIDEVRRQVREHAVIVPLDLRDEDGESRPPEAVADASFDPREAIARSELAAALRRILDETDATCRDAIEDFYLADLSYNQIAEKRGIAVNTVGSRLAKCLEKLRKNLTNDPLFRELLGKIQADPID